jgi:hypothetical protein
VQINEAFLAGLYETIDSIYSRSQRCPMFTGCAVPQRLMDRLIALRRMEVQSIIIAPSGEGTEIVGETTPEEQVKAILKGLRADLETLTVPDFDGLPWSFHNLADAEVSSRPISVSRVGPCRDLLTVWVAGQVTPEFLAQMFEQLESIYSRAQRCPMYTGCPVPQRLMDRLVALDRVEIKWHLRSRPARGMGLLPSRPWSRSRRSWPASRATSRR